MGRLKNYTLSAPSKVQNILGTTKEYDGRSLAALHRKFAQMKSTDAILELIKAALSASHILFDR